MIRRLGMLVAAVTLQLVAVVLAHELVFLVRYGSRFGEALVHSGHGATWSGAVTTSLLLGAGLGIVALGRLVQLGVLVRRQTGATGSHRALEPRLLLRIWLRAGSSLAVVGAIVLTVQENLERASIGATAPGVGILLSPEYAGGLWIALAVGLAVGLVAALFMWRHQVLLARLRALRPSQPRVSRTPARQPRIVIELPRKSILGRRSALRAPPAPTAT